CAPDGDGRRARRLSHGPHPTAAWAETSRFLDKRARLLSGRTQQEGPVRRLRVAILDLIANGPTRNLWNRGMEPNFSSIMPQAVAVWCEEAGHAVTFVSYTGLEDLARELPPDTDVLFIGAFTNAAYSAAAISQQYRRRGAVTVLGGPHARCYPDDAARYFDYVLGFTDRAIVHEVLRDCAPHRPVGLQ